MREQIRLRFYSQLFMSASRSGRAPFRQVLGYEKMLDERARPRDARVVGNAIEAADAFDRMGADVMRWQFCAQPPDRNLLFGYGPAHEIKRKLLTLCTVRFFVDYANIAGFQPSYGDLGLGLGDGAPLDRWLVARTPLLVREATRYESSPGACSTSTRRTSTTCRTGTSRPLAAPLRRRRRAAAHALRASSSRRAYWFRSRRSSPSTSG